MSTSLLSVPRQLAESALSVVGIRGGTEEPPHTARDLGDGIEIRRYEERIAAETAVDDTEEGARNAGFRLLAGYIFGGNDGGAKIAMTAPVAQQRPAGTKIAMTAPVSQTAGSDGGWVIRFYMPARWTMAELPTPNDDRVRLVTVPPETVAVLRFSGSRDARAVAAKVDELRKILQRKGIEPTGEVRSWFYDPPWTLPFLRRSEVVVPIDETAETADPTD